MQDRSWHRVRSMVAVGLVALVAAACTATGSGGAAPANAVSTVSSFDFPSGTATVPGVNQAFDVLQLAPSTTWSQHLQLTNGTSDVGTSTLALVGGAALNADGSLPATLSLTVTGKGTGNTFSTIFTDPISAKHDVTCTTTSTATTCAMPVTLPAASTTSPLDITVTDVAATPQNSTTSWWTGGMQIGSDVYGVGFITIPGATLKVDTAAPVTDQTVYDGTQTACGAVPTSSVQWLSPQNEASSGGTATYTSSTIVPGACPATFSTLAPGHGQSGVQVTSPS